MSGPDRKPYTLFLDDTRIASDVRPDLDPVWIVTARSALRAIALVRDLSPFVAWQLDHDLNCRLTGRGRGFQRVTAKGRELTGLDFLRWAAANARDKWPIGRVSVHSANPGGAAAMRRFVETTEAAWKG